MANIDVALEDRVESYWKAARVLRVVAWTSIVWGCLTTIWIWTGLKAGSDMWLIWTIVQFVVGGVCLVAAWLLASRAARMLAGARLVIDNRERAA